MARVGLDEIGGFSSRQGTVYQFDVRSVEAFLGGHLPGFVSAPGGQLVQETDYYAPVRGATMILADDDGTRPTSPPHGSLRWVGRSPSSMVSGQLTAARTARASSPRPTARHRVDLRFGARFGETGEPERFGDRFGRVQELHGRAHTWRNMGQPRRSPNGLGRQCSQGLDYVLTAREPVLIGFAVIDLDWLPGIVVGLQAAPMPSRSRSPLTSEGGQMLSTPRDRYRRPYEGTDV